MNYTQNIILSWCPPCQIFKWIYNKVASDFKDIFTFVKIDYDSFSEFVKEHDIEGFPMLLVSKQGKIVDKGPAFMSKDIFAELLNQLK